ncbi:MAG: phage major tail tube protein [Deltaproteobacteria bacterium]|nr:phage major tail tube protein [Deltaproteobacteria bacterium]
MANQVPEKLQDFRVYLEDVDLLGVADVTLPKMEFETEELKGAGLAGTIDSPVLGHFKSMTCEINFRVVTQNFVKLAAPKSHHLAFYGAVQVHDAGEGKLLSKQCKVVVRGLAKVADLGKLDSGKLQENKAELEVHYLKLSYDGADYIEMDKLNYVYVVDGEDYLAEVRANLGLG